MNKIGSCLIVGGGIAGTQAALDLAEFGIKVYLVEKDFAIGGTMAKLDKTFPTNDCSMCILSPKLVEAGRHNNIELITNAEVISVEGEPGDFKVKVREKARYVDLEKCKGCGDCAEVCTVPLPNYYEENLSERKAIFRLYDQAVPSAFAITKVSESPCRAACPIHVNAHGYIALIRNRKYKEALDLVREKNPFPLITGRICTHPCEDNCTRLRFDQPVAIDMLKRFVADKEFKETGDIPVPEIEEEREQSIGIVGAGPAGLMCAYKLRKKGYKVTIYESQSKPGGTIYFGIPSYRLPRDILFKELSIVEKMGVEIKYNTTIGKDISFSELKEKHDAVFIGIGALRSKKMKVEGEELDGVVGALEFLMDFNLGKEVNIGEKVVVVGGGNSAMDAARTAKRLGKDVTILYRRTEKEMPANREEIEEAKEEGIKFILLANPVKFVGNGKVEKIIAIRMKLGEPDESGRRRPVPIEGSEFEIEADTVIEAISQQVVSDGFEEFNKTKWGTFEVDPVTFETSVKGVFAGGDCVLGPATFIEALYHGKEGAESIDRFLNNKDMYAAREKGPYENFVPYDFDGLERIRRTTPEMLSVEERMNFNEVVKGFSEEQALREAERCLNCVGCSECMECLKACEPEAIFHDMETVEKEIEVGAVILSPGFDEYDPAPLTEYGFGRYPNVITSIQFERILSASGPTKGELVRPSDNKHIKKLAFIQCVGSRNEKIGKGYCSSVCCMYAVKEAVIAKEHSSEIEPTIFFMDVRSYGKDFDKYVDRAENKTGVKIVRCRISNIEEDENKNLILVYEEDGKLIEEKYDLVVLSVGLSAPDTVKSLSDSVGIKLNKYQFAERDIFSPVTTDKKGIFVAGAFSSPKDIPETVAEASGAASEVMTLLTDVKGTEVEKKEFPPEKDVRNEPARIGVFICHCGRNIGAYLGVKDVVEYARTLPGVVFAGDNLYTCSQDAQEKMKDIIKEHNINRVVVASCTPRTHEPLFQQTIREAGLNKYLFEMANIRDQDSWVHMNLWDLATEKAKDLVRMAVFKAKFLQPLEEFNLPVNKNALVIGGGISGMISALQLADMGYKTFIVEKSDKLGGNANKIRNTTTGLDVKNYLSDLIKRVESHSNIEVHRNVEIEWVEGYVGNFKTYLKGIEEPLEHGVVIITTGAEEYKPVEYMYGKNEKVLTQKELEANFDKVNRGDTVVMIQCVGSRNDEHPWCSRICCSRAVRNAIDLSEKGANVYVLYRDIRTYGMREELYSEARRKGVVFIRFNKGEEPEVYEEDGKIKIEVFDHILLNKVIFEPDFVVLSNGVVPDRENNEKLGKLYKVPLNEDGFFLEAHMKLRPVDFATEGVFLAGLAHSPKFIDEAIVQAKAAAARAALVLSKDSITSSGIVSHVNELKCIGCGLCVDVCPYNALSLIEKKVLGKMKTVAEVNAVLCKGCGSCTATCRPGAIDVYGFSNTEITTAEYALIADEKEIETVDDVKKIIIGKN